MKKGKVAELSAKVKCRALIEKLQQKRRKYTAAREGYYVADLREIIEDIESLEVSIIKESREVA